ncbi:DUF4235 domain-containing protein [Tessaracoccus rhinocerotis]|uniref:DUF4235 domain-containing protein n=1 Tax=Tessaracoccus rhinocerotis TaxID=1689449 RepID=A0A553K3T4_9ACTN|nr:DUF4235 domain-containing protein [Tessaracoccus rhinocerotis]TRY19362.1 DUF4235 domain-containing protein [Tessaracoccus rhinocerotis]
MALSEKVFWKIYAGVLGAATLVISQKLVTKAWEAATGDEPPDPNDPETPLAPAVSWAIASGLGVGISQLVMNRFVQRRWLKNMGHRAPGGLTNKLDLKKK